MTATTMYGRQSLQRYRQILDEPFQLKCRRQREERERRRAAFRASHGLSVTSQERQSSPDVCCGLDRIFKADESLSVCQRCGNTVERFTLTTDVTEQHNVQYSFNPVPRNMEIRQYNPRSEASIKNFERFLRQHSEDESDPPASIMGAIITDLRKNQLNLDQPITSKYISNLLITMGQNQYGWKAMRICMLLQQPHGSRRFILSNQLIDRLMARMMSMYREFKRSYPRLKWGKIFVLPSLTKHLLHMEGEYELAEMLCHQKTREVLTNINAMLYRLCDALKESEPEVNWEFLTLF